MFPWLFRGVKPEILNPTGEVLARFRVSGTSVTQRLQYPLIQEYALKSY